MVEDGLPRIVVLGAGFGGLKFVRAFRGRARVTLIDRTNHHLFQPLLYQVATAALSATEIAEPVRAIFRKRRNVEVVMDSVTKIDLDQRVVRAEREDYPYDYLVIGLGGRTSYFGNDHWAEHAPGLKTLDDALRVRRTMLTNFELAETVDLADEKKRLMRTVVIGGGPTGVELAGAMADLTRKIFKRDFRHIDPSHAQIILVQGGNQLLKGYPDPLCASAKRQLESLGVEVRLDTRVTDIAAGKVWLGDETIEAGNILWGGGVVASPVVQALSDFGVEQARGGRVKVQGDLSIPDRPEVFVIGDAASLENPDGQLVPGVAQGALQMGAHVARLLTDELKARTGPSTRERFVYHDKGSMATIGRSKAVAHVYGMNLSGFPAWVMWLVVHLAFLVGFRNKVVTLIQWVYQYVTFRNGARIIPPSPEAHAPE